MASLTNGSARQSGFVDNTSSQNLDALIRISTKGIAGATGTLDVYVYASAESSGSVYTDGATGSDATFSVANLLNSPLLGQITMNGTNGVVAGPWGVAEKFGGTLPPHWGLIFVNNSGQTLDGTGANHAVVYQGTYAIVQ